eukprot:551372_1
MEDIVELYTTLLLSTCGILLIIWIMLLQQYCVSDFHDKQRLQRILYAVLFTSLSFILNILMYLSCIYPTAMFQDVSLVFIQCMFEALYVIIAFHIFRIFHLWSINQFYKPINMPLPAYYYYFFNVLQAIVIVMVLICYGAIYFTNDQRWAILFYIFISFVILTEAIFALFNLKKTSNLFKHSQKNALIIAAKRYIRTIRVVAISICMYSCFQAIMCFFILINYELISFNHSLGIAVTHSIIFIVLGLVLILWIYQRIPCCGCCGHMDESSVCIVYGCDGFCEFWYYLCYCYGCKCCNKTIGYDEDFDSENSKTAVLLQESTNITVNSTGTHTTGLYVTIERTEKSTPNATVGW